MANQRASPLCLTTCAMSPGQWARTRESLLIILPMPMNSSISLCPCICLCGKWMLKRISSLNLLLKYGTTTIRFDNLVGEKNGLNQFWNSVLYSKFIVCLFCIILHNSRLFYCTSISVLSIHLLFLVEVLLTIPDVKLLLYSKVIESCISVFILLYLYCL